MSFVKSLLLAILATALLTYLFASGFLALFAADFYINGELLAPLQALGISAVATVILLFMALAIVLSVFGSLIFISLLLAGSLAMVVMGLFWPILLIAVIIWLVTKNHPCAQAQQHSS